MKDYYSNPEGFVFELPFLNFPVIMPAEERLMVEVGDIECLNTIPLLRKYNHTSSLVPSGRGTEYVLGRSADERTISRHHMKIETGREEVIM